MTHIIEDWKLQEMLAAAKEEGRKAAMGDVEPVVIKVPDYHYEAMGCGLEDRNITDRYEAMYHGWDCAISRMFEQIPDEPLFTAPPRAILMRVAEEVYAACEKSQTFTSATRGLDISAIVDRITGEQK